SPRYGWSGRSSTNSQMMRGIASPSSAATGLTTLILPRRSALQLSGTGAPGRLTASGAARGARSVAHEGVADRGPGYSTSRRQDTLRPNDHGPHRETTRRFSGGAPPIFTHLPGRGGKMPP